MKKLNMFLLGVLVISLLSLSALAASNCNGGKIKVTLVSAQANLVSDVYLERPFSQLLIENTLANVGKTVEVSYTENVDSLFSILVHGDNSSYRLYSFPDAKLVRQGDANNLTLWAYFEDDISLNSDRDYNDVVLKIEIKKNTCAQETTCTDTDGGKNYYVKGKLSYQNNNVLESLDSCADNNYLIEKVCTTQDDDAQNYVRFYCQYGCKDGACIQGQEKTCTDSDRGLNYFVKGTTHGYGDTTSNNIDTITDHCLSDTLLGEQFCEGPHSNWVNPTIIALMEYDCAQVGKVCRDGACVYGGGTASNTTSPAAICKTFNNLQEGETLKFNQGASTVSQVISQGGFFSLGNYQLQYKGADSITKENPKIKFKELGSGDTLEYSLGVKGEKAEFSIKLGGKAYYFESASDTRVDNFKIVLLSGSTSSGNQKEITLVYTDSTPTAKFEVNGESTDKLRRGQSYTLVDGAVLTVGEIIFQSYAGGIHSAQFCINGEKVTKTTETLIEPTPITLEANLANYPQLFVTNGKFNGYLVVGEMAKPIDNLALTDIAVGLQEEGYTVVDATKLDSELPNPFVRNLIVVGRPEENQIVKTLTGVSQASDLLKPGESMIALYNNKGFAQLLVMGYSAEDTRTAARVLAHYKNYNLGGNQVMITGTFPNVHTSSETTTAGIEPVEETAIPPEPVKESTSTPQAELLPSICNSGCKVNGNCLPYGTRLVQDGLAKFCDINQQLGSQKELGASCQNNYECFSNQCSNSKCIDLSGQIQQTQNFLEKIWSWATRFFGVKN